MCVPDHFYRVELRKMALCRFGYAVLIGLCYRGEQMSSEGRINFLVGNWKG